MSLRFTLGLLPLLAAGTAAAVAPALDPATVGGISADGPRARYEASLGTPPRVLAEGGALGHRWQGNPPYIAGASRVSLGEFIYDDRPFDDTGADTLPDTTTAAGWDTSLKGLCSTLGGHRHGEYTYPADARHLKNSADLIELRVAADADNFFVLFQLQTLIDATTTTAVLLLEPAAGGTAKRLEIHGATTDSVVATLDGTPVAGAVDLAANTFEARLPRGALPAGALRLTAWTGNWDGVTTTVTDLAFVDEPVIDELDCWGDKVQSAAITANNYPKSPVLDPDALRAGASDAPTLVRGAMLRLHAPSIDLGEGIVGQPKYGQQSAANLYRGKLQPYAAYVPASYDEHGDNPLILVLHCLDCNHLTYQLAAWPGLKQLAESRGAIIVTPLAYGEGGHYEEEAEWDVFDVMSDVSRRYRIDRERIYLSGMSMGSLGTFRLGSLYPDLWAAAAGWGIYTTPFCVTASPTKGGCSVAPFNYFNFLEGFHNIPIALNNGAQDELTPVSGAREIAGRFDALGSPYRYWEYPERQHEPRMPGTTSDLVDPYLGQRRRIASPARVRYVFQRSVENPAWGLTYTRAYWLHDLRYAAAATLVDIDARSGRGTQIATSAVSGSGTSTAGAGAYTMQGLDDAEAMPANGPNTLNLRLRGVTSAAIDLAQARLMSDEPLTVTVDTDVPVHLDLGAALDPIDAPVGNTGYERGGLGESHPLLGALPMPFILYLLLVALARRFV